jgi:hypothetical protein
MIERVYSEAPGVRKPDLVVFDSNCRLAQYVKNRNKTWWDTVGLPVDVFHFKTKHKQTDVYCQEWCNPAMFKELLVYNPKTQKDEWFFNTSIAEQTNVWLGGFHSICREMRAVFFDFFLDQMILLRNEVTRTRLAAEGVSPQYWPTKLVQK